MIRHKLREISMHPLVQIFWFKILSRVNHEEVDAFVTPPKDIYGFWIFKKKKLGKKSAKRSQSRVRALFLPYHIRIIAHTSPTWMVQKDSLSIVIFIEWVCTGIDHHCRTCELKTDILCQFWGNIYTQTHLPKSF